MHIFSYQMPPFWQEVDVGVKRGATLLSGVSDKTCITWNFQGNCMNSMKLVIPLHSLYWSIHTKDESKRGTAFAFIFGVN